MLKKTSNYIWPIIILALVLRFVGIQHGFPFISHPDEATIVNSALGVRFDLNPRHFDWPHLFIYLNYFLYMAFAKLRDVVVAYGYKAQVQTALPLVWNDDLIFYFLSRSFAALLGALTVIPVFLTTKTLFGKRAGLLAALAMAVVPFHVWHSHYALADVPMMFFLAWSLYFSALILFKKDTANYVWAGLFAGLAASTKYNGLLIAGAIILAHFIRVLSEKDESTISLKFFGSLVIAGFTTVVGFLVGTPFALLDYKTFMQTDSPQGALWQFTNVGNVDFSTHVKQFFDVLTFKLPENFGYTLLILFLSAFVYVMLNAVKNKKMWINKDLLFFTLVGLGLIFYVSGLEKTRAHYFFIAYPAVIVGGIGFLSQQLDKVSFKFKELSWVVVFLLPLYLSITSAYTFYKYDTAQQLYYWLSANKNKLGTVFISDADLIPIFKKAGVPEQRVESVEEISADYYYLVVADDDSASYHTEGLKKVLILDNIDRRGQGLKVYTP